MRKMSCLKKPIDYKLLENELDDAIKADELYKLRNDAKFRAIEQKVPTYDHFRNMVEAAHLRPLERSEMNKKPEVSWNHCFSKSEDYISGVYYKEANLFSKSTVDNVYDANVEPKTTTEFLKIWKHLSDYKSKFEYLVKYRYSLKDNFFKAEVTTEFLQEYFKLALDNCSADAIPYIIEILQIFSKCNRFSLSLAMISVAEKKIMQLLFENLLLSVKNDTDTDSVKKLLKTYCISVDENTMNSTTTMIQLSGSRVERMCK